MNCKRCGKSLPSDVSFCPYCGLQDPFPHWHQKSQSTSVDDEDLFSPSSSGTPTPTPPQQENKPAPKKKGGSGKMLLGLIAIVIIIVLIVNFGGRLRIRGTWYSPDGTYSMTFSDGNKGYIQNHGIAYSSSQRQVDFTYEFEGKEVIIHVQPTLYTNGMTMRYEYSFQDGNMIFTDPNTGISDTMYKH